MLCVHHAEEIPDEDRSSSFERMLRALDLGRRYGRLYIRNGKLGARLPPVKRMTRSARWPWPGGRDSWSGFCANVVRRTVGRPSPWHRRNTRRSGATLITVSLLSGTAAETNRSSSGRSLLD